MAANGSVRIGSVEITTLLDSLIEAPRNVLFPEIAREAWEPYRHHLSEDGLMRMTIPAFLVRASGKTIVVDTGIGAKGRPGFPDGTLPESMAAAGVRAEDVDSVIATHMHIDHGGWHTPAKGDGFVPTFPNATYVFHRDEYAYFTASERVDTPALAYVRDCVLPLRDAAAIELVGDDYHPVDEITLIATPGHTPAHMSVAISSSGESCVIIGDVCHHPAQMDQTGWSPIFDLDGALSARSRERLMQRIETERMLVAAGHFEYPGLGRIVRVEGRRMWRGI